MMSRLPFFLNGEVCNYGDCINVDTADIADDAWILDLDDIEKDTGRIFKKIKKFQGIPSVQNINFILGKYYSKRASLSE